MIKSFFVQILMRPIFNLLIVFVAIFGGNLGLGVVALTVLIRILMLRVTSASNQMQHGMNDLQPKLDEIQKKYADDPNKMAEETMKAFKKEGKGPLKGCLGSLIQLPIFLALYWTVRKMTEGTIPEEWLYSFFYSFGDQFASTQAIDNGNIQNIFLGINLFESHNIWLTVIATVLTILQMKLTNLVKPQTATPQKGPNGEPMPDMSKMMGMMTWFMAFMMGSVVYSIQSAIGLYIVTTTLFSICQYTYQYREYLHAERLKFRNKPQIIKKK